MILKHYKYLIAVSFILSYFTMEEFKNPIQFNNGLNGGFDEEFKNSKPLFSSIPFKKPKKVNGVKSTNKQLKQPNIFNASANVKFLRDEIYEGLIELHPFSMKIINHEIFQRMKNIKQLGPVAYHKKFQAKHTRYEHSIGTAYLARHVMKVLKQKHPEITEREMLCVEIAALCHDIGHGPFSHMFDFLLEQNTETKNNIMIHHEARSQFLVKYIIDSINNEESTKHITPLEVSLIQYFIEPVFYIKNVCGELNKEGHPVDLPPFYYGIEQIVSNSKYKLDVDKMDYIVRDAHGMRFDVMLSKETIDIFGILDQSMILNHDWTFSINHLTKIIELFNRRYIFHTNGYSHPEVSAMDCMLRDALTIANNVMHFTQYALLNNVENVEYFCNLTDDVLINLICNSTHEKMHEAIKLVNNVIDNVDLYEHIGDFVSDCDQNDENIIQVKWNIDTNPSSVFNIIWRNMPFHSNGIKTVPSGKIHRCFSKR